MAFDRKGFLEEIDAAVREFVERKSPGFDASKAELIGEVPQQQDVSVYERVELIGFLRGCFVFVFKSGTLLDRIVAVPLGKYALVTLLFSLLGYHPPTEQELMASLHDKTIEIVLAKPAPAGRHAKQSGPTSNLDIQIAAADHLPGCPIEWPPAQTPLPLDNSEWSLAGTGATGPDYPPESTTTTSSGTTTPPPATAICFGTPPAILRGAWRSAT